MSVERLLCPKCGATVSKDKETCEYCGTHYIVRGRRTLNLLDLPATDENLERFISLTNLALDHRVKRMGVKRVASAEELAQIVRNAREDLREELEREPTIRQVDLRAGEYLKPKKQAMVAEQSVKVYVLAAILSLFGFLFLLLIFYILMTSR